MTNNNDSGMFRIGDLVVGSTDPGKSVYSATGSKLINSGVSLYGNAEDLLEQQKKLTKLAARNGGVVLETQGSSRKKKKKSQSTVSPRAISFSENADSFEQEDTSSVKPPAPVKLLTVQFENDFGKMRAKVEALVDHDLAYMLVFPNEDAVVFEPKISETLSLHLPDGETVAVYYPGVTFNSPDSDRKFMILFKVPEENQE